MRIIVLSLGFNRWKVLKGYLQIVIIIIINIVLNPYDLPGMDRHRLHQINPHIIGQSPKMKQLHNPQLHLINRINLIILQINPNIVIHAT